MNSLIFFKKKKVEYILYLLKYLYIYLNLYIL